MRQSKLFTKTAREIPSDEPSKNAQILTRAGYIHKQMSGVYEFLPLGLRSINKIIEIIREEMNSIGGQEIFMSALQDKSIWEKTDRWDDENVDVWFKTNLAVGGQIGLGWTHEEAITNMMTHHIFSYKDLPISVYQFQTKFRNEKRAKSGIMRSREFLMKDLYTFSQNADEHKIIYEECAEAYKRIFERIEIGDKTYRTLASGGAFSKFSDEFQTECEVGEDIIYIDRKKGIAINQEVYNDETISSLGLKKDSLEKIASAEVGNIFTLGTRFSEPLKLLYKDKEGNEHPVFMGSYGIGPARMLGVAVELFFNEQENKLLLPKSISPFSIHLIDLSANNNSVKDTANEVYKKLSEKTDVLIDDRDEGAGEKFSDADIIGIPNRIIVSQKSIDAGGVEYIDRKNNESKILSIEEIVELF